MLAHGCFTDIAFNLGPSVLSYRAMGDGVVSPVQPVLDGADPSCGPSPNRDATKGLRPTFWGNAAPPTSSEWKWMRSFGRYPDFQPSSGKLSARLTLREANLREATRIIVHYHYLHRGRTMAQLPYWIMVDRIPVGVLLFALPRLSVTLYGIRPMNLLELARLWISPDVQGRVVVDSRGKEHSVSVATAALGKALRLVRQDWYRKYPKLPDVHAIVSWADTVHHEGVIYHAANFRLMGRGGGTLHGSTRRPNGGRDQTNPDYTHVKSVFLYQFQRPLSVSEKRHIDLKRDASMQLALCPAGVSSRTPALPSGPPRGR
jgi:hypothetical protein